MAPHVLNRPTVIGRTPARAVRTSPAQGVLGHLEMIERTERTIVKLGFAVQRPN